MNVWAPPPFRIKFDEARDPYTARNALGIAGTGAGLITSVTAPLAVTGGNLTVDLSGYQPLDADLTAIAALTGTNTIYYRSAANTWSAVTVSTGLSFTGGTLANTVAEGIPHCGRLEYVSTTALKFSCFNGDRIRIAGTIYAIPSAGITTGLTNGGLSAATTYYVYVYNNAGTLTGEFSATGHATSTTSGNIGTEIKSGDNTRTLIGIIRTAAGSGTFYDAVDYRLVRSWFNRAMLATLVSGSGSTTSASYVNCGSVTGMVCFAGEASAINFNGFASGASPVTVAANLGVDGATAGGGIANWIAVAGVSSGATQRYVAVFAEGYHYAQMKVASNGAITGSISGDLMWEIG